MLKNYLRYVLPASLILLALFGWAIAATTLQSWQSTTPGAGTVSIDSNGDLTITGTNNNASFNYSPSASAGTLAITSGTLSGGTLGIFEPHGGTYFKSVLITASSAVATGGTLGITFPTAFAQGAGTMSTGGVTSGTMSMALATATTAGITGGTLTLSGTPSGVLLMGGN